jgi:hypothetical protein
VWFKIECMFTTTTASTPVFAPCQFLRSKSKQICVIRLESTGVIMEIELEEALDIGRACHVCATKPVDAVVSLGEWRGGIHRQCELRVTSWQTSGGPGGAVSYPPPVRYVRKPRVTAVNPPALKRCKTSPD